MNHDIERRLLDVMERQAQHGHSALIGTLGGRILEAGPVRTPPNPGRILQRAAKERHTFHHKGAPAAGFSDPYAPELSLRWALALLTTAGSTATTVTLYKNGAAVGTVTIAAGAIHGGPTTLAVAMNRAATPPDRVTVQATALGTGANGLVVQTEYWD